MSTLNHEKSASRAISNAMFLSQMLKVNIAEDRGTVFTQMVKQLELKINEALLVLLPGSSQGASSLELIKSNELKTFILKCCFKIGQNYMVGPNRVASETKFLIGCTNPFFRGAAKVLLEQPEELEKCSLFHCYQIGLYNRILCIAAEEFVSQNPKRKPWVAKNVPGPSDNPFPEVVIDKFPGNWLYAIWHKAQRARSGTFNQPLKPQNDKLVGETIQEIEKLFSKAQANPMCPFNSKVHRLRENSINQNERYLLSIGAGANTKRPLAESTLGLVEKALGLPERCDISGTTTDAVGLGKALPQLPTTTTGGKDKQLKIPDFDAQLFVLTCIVSMCLQGHHSLDEMGAALSISIARKYYNPLNPPCLPNLLNGLPAPNGLEIKFPESKIYGNWISAEWLAISGYGANPSDPEEFKKQIGAWDFTDQNWRVWKMFANVMNKPYAP